MLTFTAAGRRSIPYRMIASVPSVVTFMSFFFIVVSVFSVLGMQLFGGVSFSQTLPSPCICLAGW